MIILIIIVYPKLKVTKQIDKDIEEKNLELNNRNLELHHQNQELQIFNNNLISSKDYLISNIQMLKARKEETISSINELHKQSENMAETLYQKNIELIQEKLSNSSLKESEKYQNNIKSYEEEYLTTLKECSENFETLIAEKRKELEKVEYKLSDLKRITEAAVNANKRAEEERNKVNFYRLNIPEADLEEINKLKEVSKYLRNAEPLNKVIWKVYYENPYTDLIGRVIGKGTHTGIYKITNLQNGMCYVGQAANLSDRWKQHIKRGLGAETPTKNKLYPAMSAIGVENFSFEVIEECERTQLNDREDYWQEYFKAKEFGYSIK